MNSDTFLELTHFLQNNPKSVIFDGNIIDLPDGSSIYCGEMVHYMDADQNLIRLNPIQQQTLRCVVDYCYNYRLLES